MNLEYIIKYTTPSGGIGRMVVWADWLEANAAKFFKKMKKVRILSMEVKKRKPKYWAVARKGYFRVIAVYGSKEQALREVEGKDYLEVREIIA